MPPPSRNSRPPCRSIRGWAMPTTSGIDIPSDGRSEESIQHFKGASDLDPNNAFAARDLCLVHAQRGQFGDARSVLAEGLAKTNPTAARASPSSGNLSLHENRGGDAIEAFRPPRFIRNSSKPTTTAAWLCRVWSRLREALSCYDRALRLRPKYAAALSGRRNALLALDRRPETRSEPARAPSTVLEANSLLDQGNRLYGLERYAEAVGRFDQALTFNPRLAGAHSNRASALAALGRTEDALESVDRALRIEPDLINALINRATLLQEPGRPAEALSRL